MPTNRLRTFALAPFAVLAACLFLAACGGGSSSPSGSAASASDNALKFSKCMREHGIKDFPNPETTANGATRLQFKVEGGIGPKTMEAAQEACRHFQEEGGPAEKEVSPQEKVEREEQVQKFAKCMREHGIELEVSTSGDAVKIGVHPGDGGPNPESPAFQQAQEACQDLMPGPKGGPGGPTTSTHGKEASAGGAGFNMESAPAGE